MKNFHLPAGVTYLLSLALQLLLLLVPLGTQAFSFFTGHTEFALAGNTLYMNNVITSKTPSQVYQIFAQYPNIKTIEMEVVDGSIDDTANLEIARWVAKKGLTLKLGRYGVIASGGTDFFFSGKQRIIVDGAMVGVHSWGTGLIGAATDYPRGHELHQPYIAFYQAMGLSPAAAKEFYYFTINAAGTDDVYFMTNDELIGYQVTNTGITKPEFIVKELEAERKAEGFAYLSEAAARKQGIEVITINEYQRRLAAQNRIPL